ncbi:MAG: hypothetical protein U0232_17850 [Thermomicrobiales bacterium]
MNENGSRSLAEARALVGALRGLGAVEAPTTLLAGVLGELGVSDLAFPVKVRSARSMWRTTGVGFRC